MTTAKSTPLHIKIITPLVVAATLAVVAGRAAAESNVHADDRRASPALPADFQRGVNHAHIHRSDRGYGSDVSKRELAELRRLGVTHIALNPFGYQRAHDATTLAGFVPGDGEAPDRFVSRDTSMPDESLVREAEHARALGMRVIMKPHIWSRDFWGGEQWHGTIQQKTDAGHRAWWRAYRAMLLHYAALAQRGRMDALVLGAELVLMTKRYPDDWRQLARDVRKVFSGQVTYAAHWEDEVERIPFWDELDYIGIGAYYPLDLPDGAETAQLERAWAKPIRSLDALAKRTGKQIVFLEVGYRPATGAYRRPWEYSGGAYDGEAQARAFDAMFRALSKQPWWRGAYFWKTFTDPNGGVRGGRAGSFTFRNLPAEAVLARWYRAGSEN